MKKNIFFKFSALGLLLVTILFSSCDRQVEENEDVKLLQTLESYTKQNVIPTYQGMANKAMDLLDICEQMKFQLTDSKMNEASTVWRECRLFWEQSEAFLFGPAEYNSLDPHIDSWPLDKNRLDQVLASSGILQIDAAYARNNFGSSLLGFHAIEYILFRDGQARSANKVTDAELAYLVAVTEVLAQDCILLEGGWSGYEALSSEKKQLLQDADLSISSNFGKEMINAGKTGSRYATARQAIEEIIEGCKSIADEVGNSKIADPVESGNVLDVESWYSWNSINDFVNNILSIKNSYLGSRDGESSHSISKLVVEKNPALDNEIRKNIENAIKKIRDIGDPFRNHLDNVEGAAEATEACDNLYISLKKINTVIY